MKKSLSIKKTPILDPEEPVKLREAFELIEEIESYLEKEMGIGDYPEPTSKPPELSEGLADRADALTNSELCVLHAQYVAWTGFLETRLARIKAAQKAADGNLDQINAQLHTELYVQDIAKAEVPMHVKKSPLYRSFYVEALKLYMMRQILEARADAYRRSAEAISRLITIRTEEMGLSKQDPAKRRPMPKPKTSRFRQFG